MGRVKKMFIWWWGWQATRIEGWLEEMEAQGWNLQRVWANGLRFQFISDEPRTMRYCFDYQEQPDDHYKVIFRDAGWNLVWFQSGWFLWAQEYQRARPEIYTDVDSLIERNNRLIKVLALASLAQLPVVVSILASGMFRFSFFMIIWLTLTAILAYALVGFLVHNRLLRQGK